MASARKAEVRRVFDGLERMGGKARHTTDRIAPIPRPRCAPRRPRRYDICGYRSGGFAEKDGPRFDKGEGFLYDFAGRSPSR